MKTNRRALPLLLALCVLAFGFTPSVRAQISLTTPGSAVTESFTGLANTGTNVTWTDNSTVSGWYSTRTTYNAATGSTNTGSLYSFGVAGTNPVTDRALGGIASGGTGTFYWAARYVNNTGVTITSLKVDYNGEQWRDGGNATNVAQTMAVEYQIANAGVITDADTPSTGWTAAPALDFTSPIFNTTAAALDGNAPANRAAISSTLSVSVLPGQEIWIRWVDINNTGNDHGLAVDDVSVTPNPIGPPTVNLSIDDVSQVEGDSGTTTFSFTVSLSVVAPAPVTFDIATADNTATTADNDYLPNSLTGQTIMTGDDTFTFDVTVNGDTTVEANQDFFVNVTNISGATGLDTQGVGTIINDDVTLTPIHDIQGPGASSPLSGVVTTRGIVTGLKSNGFYIQEPDASVDADPATSEGIFVFTSSAPPPAAAVGNLVQVTGTISEFVPSQDPMQPPLTELTSPAVVQVSTGNPLPTPVVLSTTLPDPAGAFDQLERYEGMRVSLASMTVVAPTLGSISEANATATSQGVFFGVATGLPRAFREAGVQDPDTVPTGTIPPIPRFDTNPEVIRVDSDALVGTTAINVSTGAVVSNLVGPLDYTFRHYTILPESTLAFSGGMSTVAATLPAGDEFTVAGYNLQRFFDTINDPATSDPVLTSTAFNARLAKASLGIRNFLHYPDIIGVSEVENLSTLQAIAAQISTDAVGAGDPDPLYQAYLTEGNDVGGIDVGFLVKTGFVSGITPRVTVLSVVQENAGELLVNPDSSTDLLNDRPPLVLDAIVNHANGEAFPVTVIVNHLRSLNGMTDEAPGPNGWPTGGARVRAKRQKQAESLALLVQARQTADPAEHIIVLGDFNAFEVNDGYVHSMAVIGGTPVPDNETVVIGDGVDLLDPDLTNLGTTPPPAEQYSYVFDGNAQTLDHLLANAVLLTDTLAARVEHPRINADFPETARNNADERRLSDHDPVLAYFRVAGFAEADLAITKTDSPDPVVAGTNLTYTITAINAGPNAAAAASWSDTLPAGTTFVSLSTVAGWSCTTPSVGSGGTVSCSNTSFAVGNSVFTLTVAVAPTLVSALSNTATISASTPDPNPGDNSATEITTVSTLADVSITKVGTPDPVNAGANLSYAIAVTNSGPSNAATVALADTLPANTTFVSLTSPGGWSCTTPSVGSGGTVNCSIATQDLTTANFTLVVQVDAATAPGTSISNTATASSGTPDPDSGDLSATDTATVISPADLTATKTVSGSTEPGGTVDYQIVITNNGPSQQGDYAGDEFVDVLPLELILSGASASSGTALVDLGTNTVTWNGAIPVGGTVTIDIMATLDPAAAPGSTVSNQATINWDADGDGVNEASGNTDDPSAPGGADPTTFVIGAGVPPVEVPVLDLRGLLALAALIAAVAVFRLRR